MAVFVYALIDPDTKETRYVGCSNGPRARLRSHIRSARNPWSEENHDLGNWIRHLLARKKRPLMAVLQKVPRAEWGKYESDWIARLRRANASLLNIKAGGGGRFSLPGEHRTAATSFRAEHYNALKRIADARAASIPAVVREIVAAYLKREGEGHAEAAQLPT